MSLTQQIAVLREALEKLPRRQEKISGQTFSYIKLEDVVAVCAALSATAEPATGVRVKPMIWGWSTSAQWWWAHGGIINEQLTRQAAEHYRLHPE